MDLSILRFVDDSHLMKANEKVADGWLNFACSPVQIQPARSPDQDSQRQHLLAAQCIQVTVKIIPRYLCHPSALTGIGNLIEIKFENIGL